MKKFQWMIFGTLLGVLVSLTGCHGEPVPEGLPKLFPCELTFEQEGKPLVGAVVMLTSKNKPCPWSVGGTTDENGTAIIRTHGKFVGAPEGTFIVTVNKEELEDLPEDSNKRPMVYSLVDSQYTTSDESTLEVVVSAKTIENYDIGAEARIEAGRDGD